MKPIHCCFATIALIVFSASVALAADKKPDSKPLIDFTSGRLPPDGGLIKKVGYTWGDWQDKVIEVPDKGVLVNGLGGKGGMGANESLDFGDGKFAELFFVIGSRNQAESFNLSLVDRDGTDQFWSVPLQGQPKGTVCRIRLPLKEPTKVDQPGKVSAFDKRDVATWQIKGNYQDAVVAILVMKLNSAN